MSDDLSFVEVGAKSEILSQLVGSQIDMLFTNFASSMLNTCALQMDKTTSMENSCTIFASLGTAVSNLKSATEFATHDVIDELFTKLAFFMDDACTSQPHKTEFLSNACNEIITLGDAVNNFKLANQASESH